MAPIRRHRTVHARARPSRRSLPPTTPTTSGPARRRRGVATCNPRQGRTNRSAMRRHPATRPTSARYRRGAGLRPGSPYHRPTIRRAALRLPDRVVRPDRRRGPPALQRHPRQRRTLPPTILGAANPPVAVISRLRWRTHHTRQALDPAAPCRHHRRRRSEAAWWPSPNAARRLGADNPTRRSPMCPANPVALHHRPDPRRPPRRQAQRHPPPEPTHSRHRNLPLQRR